jgi:RHS repeat-associated protein
MTAGSPPAEQVSLATGTRTYLITDSLGSVRGTVSSSGTLTGTTNFDAWGNPLTAGGLTATTPFGYAGGYTDADGLIYLINRYYVPSTRQFASVDPQVSQTLQPYLYAAGDPVAKGDPNGLHPMPPPGGTAPAISCRHGWYYFADSDGTFYLNYACWAHAVYWWYHISRAVRAITISDVRETGLDYWVNWGPHHKNAPHFEFSWYWFHGTMSGVKNYDYVTYQDYFYFEVEVGGDTGQAWLFIAGTIRLTP